MKTLNVNESLKKVYQKKLDKKSYKFLVQLVKSGKYSWEEIENKVNIEDGKIVWQGNLDVRGTKVKKIIAERIEKNVYAEGEKSLIEIDIEDEIGCNLDVRGTSVISIKAKRIGGSVNAEGEKSLIEIEVKDEIGSYLDIEGINEDFKLKVIEKIGNGKLEVRGRIYYDNFNSLNKENIK